jgi:hypothetical protein
MSARKPPYADKALIDRLPQDKRNELISIGREAMQRFGFAYQQVFDANLQIFEYLATRGATATMIGKMLAEAGIVREDGTALPPGTVSSAMSRARERTAQRPDVLLQAPASAGTNMQVPASAGNGLHGHAGHCMAARASAVGTEPSAPVPSGLPPQLPAIRPSPNPSAATRLPTATRRAAALLEQLRSDQDDHV